MLNKVVVFLFFMFSFLSNNLYAMHEYSKGAQENSRRRTQGKYYAVISKAEVPFVPYYRSARPLKFGRNQQHYLVQFLLLTTLFRVVNPPLEFNTFSSSHPDLSEPPAPFVPSSSLNGTEVSQNHRTPPPSPYFSLHNPIPQHNRSGLHADLEVAYRRAEACEPDTVAVLKTLPKSHPFRELLEQCDTINANYISPQTLPTLDILFDKEALTSQFKVVPQFSYSISEGETLFTGNVMKCVAIALYNPNLKRGGLAHAAGENIAYLDEHLLSMEKSKTGIHEFMEDVTGTESPTEQRVTLLSGSKAHLEYYVSLMKKFGFVNFTVIQKDEWGLSKNSFYNKKLSKGSLALDPKDGIVYRIANDKFVSQWMGPPEKQLTTAGKTASLKLKKH